MTEIGVLTRMDTEKNRLLKDLRKDLKKELKKLFLDLSDPRFSNSDRRRMIEAAVPLLSGAFFTADEMGEDFRMKAEAFPSKEEHFGRNLNMPPESLPKAPEEAEKWGWDDGVGAECHQFTSPDKSNQKYVSADGHLEVIFDKDGNVVTAPEDCASYNFADPNTDPAGHFYRDVLPWIAWGNDEADSTDMSARLKAFVFAGGGNAVKNRVMPRGSLKEDAEIAFSRPVSPGGSEEKKSLSERLYSEKLYRAIDRGNPDEVRRLLAEKGDLNQVRTANPALRMIDFENIYPLEKACKTSALMAGMLLDAGADAGVIDPYLGSTPLIYALSENYEERFDLAFRLIEGGANVDQVDDNGRCALNRAAVIYDTDSDDAKKRELELVRTLFEKCDVEAVLAQCRSNPLVEAARFNNVPVIEYILDGGLIDIDRMADGYTALMKAVLANCTEACALLLERGADRTCVSPGGRTAEDYAIEKGNPGIVRLFADPDNVSEVQA